MEGVLSLPICQHRTGERTGNLFEEIIPFVRTVQKIPDDLFAQSVIKKARMPGMQAGGEIWICTKNQKKSS